MNNEEKIIYTYKHRKIIIYLAKKYNLSAKMLNKLENHDLDKIFLYLLYDKETVKKAHRLISNHHNNELNKTKDDYIEMILDWESARYTKIDKPLNAYDTLIKYYPNMQKEIMPILKELGLNKSSKEKDKDVDDYSKTLDKITINDIKKELIDFITKKL